MTKKIPNPSQDGVYNCFQSLIATPLVLVKNMKALSLISTDTLTATKLIDCPYNTSPCVKNMIQSKERDHFFVYDLIYHDDHKERALVKMRL